MDEKTVLIIEDEPDAAELFAEMMRVSGFRVVKITSSAPAMDLLTREKPDLVILDIMMPGMDGFAVFQAITERVEGRLPFLFITATALRVGEEWLRGIPHATMHKPLDFNLLFERVHQLLSVSK